MEIARILQENPDLKARLTAVRRFAQTVRSSMYHVTHACNLRCRGCWFFEYGFDTATGRDERDLGRWQELVRSERARGVSCAILIGGEPSLYLDRVALFVEELPYVWLSTNGLRPIPREGFEHVAVAVTLFGGGPLDDELRGIAPSGKRLHGLLDRALDHYAGDDRVFFVLALVPEGIPHLEPTVRRIGANGNRVLFNYYSPHSRTWSERERAERADEERLLDSALEVRERHPDTVISHPYYIRALVTGESHFGRFGFDTCPSVSHDHPGNRERLANGNPVLPGFNVYAPDTRSLNMCCTSGHCAQCRDSQAVSSWLLVNATRFMGSAELLRCWLEIAESFWSQFIWSPFHPARREPAAERASAVG